MIDLFLFLGFVVVVLFITYEIGFSVGRRRVNEKLVLDLAKITQEYYLMENKLIKAKVLADVRLEEICKAGEWLKEDLYELREQCDYLQEAIETDNYDMEMQHVKRISEILKKNYSDEILQYATSDAMARLMYKKTHVTQIAHNDEYDIIDFGSCLFLISK